MDTLTTSCGACGTPVRAEMLSPVGGAACGKCGAPTELHVFPALWREHGVNAGERLIIHDDSACFHHPEKRATIVCEGCGRFLCALCDIDYQGKHLCSGCVERGVADTGKETFRANYTRFDRIALLLAGIALVPPFWYFAIFLAPGALFLAIKNWNEPISAAPRGRGRFVVAIALAVLELMLLLGAAVMIFGAFFYESSSYAGE